MLASGRYLLAATIGEGGMATVYRGYDTRLQVWRAVKVLNVDHANRVSVLGRFEAEAQTMALLEHPHIVRVYDVGRDGGFSYIVMELVQGGCLTDWISEHGPMPAKMALNVISQVAKAIAYAHESGVVHRDIKPHNVLLGVDDLCRVTDFGIAQVVDANLQLTKTGAVMGTWGFMAPEQRSDAKTVDARADIYALGATLFTLLTNRMPNDLYRIDVDDSVTNGIAEPLVPLLRRACAYDRSERYESVAALLDEVVLVAELLPDDPPNTPRLPVHMAKTWSAPNPHDYRDWSNEGTDVASTVAEPIGVGEGGQLGLTVGVAPTLSGSWDSEATPSWSNPSDAAMHRVKAIVIALIGTGVGLGLLGLIGILLLWPRISAISRDQPLAETQPAQVMPTTAPEPPLVVERQPPVMPAPTPAVAAPAPKPALATPKPAPQPVVRQCVNVNPPTKLAVGARANFSATLCENDGTSVTLHYRPVGGADWRAMTMPLRLGKHVAQVSIDDSFAGGVQYYVTAGAVSHGSQQDPKIVAMVP